jgi:hypothetical protein
MVGPCFECTWNYLVCRLCVSSHIEERTLFWKVPLVLYLGNKVGKHPLR